MFESRDFTPCLVYVLSEGVLIDGSVNQIIFQSITKINLFLLISFNYLVLYSYKQFNLKNSM